MSATIQAFPVEVRRKIRMGTTGSKLCTTCKGTGIIDATTAGYFLVCSTCHGKGYNLPPGYNLHALLYACD